MNDLPAGEAEFAFPLPLQWPSEEEDRKAYERALIDYALLMQPLVAAAEGEQRRELLDALSDFARELRQLWGSSNTPAEIGEFIAMFD